MNRVEFLAKIHPIVDAATASKIEMAYLLSKRLHKGQFRKEKDAAGNPLRYFEHPRRVAVSLIDEAGIIDGDVIIAALLHDVVEDTEDRQLVPRMLEMMFGGVGHWVSRLSKVPKEGYANRLRATIQQDPRILLVKAADRLDNLRTLPNDEAFKARQIEETRDIYVPMFYDNWQNWERVRIPGREGFAELIKKIQTLVLIG